MSVVTRLTVREIQQAIVNNCSAANYRNNIFVPNVSWGLLPYEADLLIMDKNGYVTECEIKRSWEDFLADFRKDHKHNDERVYRFGYYLPAELEIKAKEKLNQIYADDVMNTPALFLYDEEGYIWRAKSIKEPKVYFGREKRAFPSRKLFIEEQLQLARLGCLRLWKGCNNE